MAQLKTKLVKTYILERVQWQVYSTDMQIPSVRGLAKQLGVSPFTVSQAYDSLVAEGHIYAIKGSGYFVKSIKQTPSVTLPNMTNNVFDISWLMEHLFNGVSSERDSGSGMLPSDWLMEESHFATASKKAIQNLNYIRGCGYLQGFLGLREQFTRHLDDMGIFANPSTMVTTSGTSSGITMIVQAMCQTGDTVFIDDPAWYWIIACLQNLGLTVIGVPRTEQGVDLKILAELLEQYRPRLYITNSVLHNPTSYNPTASNVFSVLQLMEKFDCYLLEDDVCSFFSPDTKMVRYATLDGFKRVFYVRGVAKLLGGNWRVAIICAPETQLEKILRQKMLTNMPTPEMTERTIYHIGQSPAFAKYIQQTQQRLGKRHQQLTRKLTALGFLLQTNNPSLFLWLDTGVDSATLALDAHKAGWSVAPGHLFSVMGRFKTHIRLNVATTSDEFLEWLSNYIKKAKC